MISAITFGLWFLAVLTAFVVFLNLLPVASTLPFAFSSSVATIVSFMKTWNFILPITEILLMVSVITTIHLAVWAFRVGWKIIHWLRGSTSN